MLTIGQLRKVLADPTLDAKAYVSAQLVNGHSISSTVLLKAEISKDLVSRKTVAIVVDNHSDCGY